MAVVRASTRLLIAERAGFVCEYCRYPERYASERHAIDHIIPRSLDGTSDLSNLAFACRGCNEAKGDARTAIDQANAREVPLYHPRHQIWAEHFGWSDDFSLILGLTAIGRATVLKLDLNRDGCINLRQALRELGRHP